MTSSGDGLRTRDRPRVTPPAIARHRFVGRQPILTASGRVFGHELLYRNGLAACRPVDRWPRAAQDGATARVLEAAFGETAPEVILAGRGPVAFVNFTRSYLVAHLPVPPMAGRLVVEIVESVRAD